VTLRLERELQRRAGVPESAFSAFDAKATETRRSACWRFIWRKAPRERTG
jgi:hypothetical protein